MDHNPFQTPTSKNELTPPVAVHAGIVSPIAFYFGVIIVGLGMALMSVQFGLLDGLTFSLFALWPLILALVPMWRYCNKPCQCIFLFADIAFLTWFVSAMMVSSANHRAFDAIATGAYSFPVLLAICMIARWAYRKGSRHPSISVCSANTVSPLALYIGMAVVLVGTIFLCVYFGLVEGMFYVPFVLGPLMLAWIPMWLCSSWRSQKVFLLANIAYVCWFLYVFSPIVYKGYMGEFDVLGILAIPICSIPVLLVLCVIAVVLQW